jgi:hypothetical protein
MRWRFELDGIDGGDTIKVTNQNLNTIERARERAEAEFLEVGYNKRQIQFTTSRIDIELNQVYNVGGIPYIVKAIEYNIGASILLTVTCERYE